MLQGQLAQTSKAVGAVFKGVVYKRSKERVAVDPECNEDATQPSRNLQALSDRHSDTEKENLKTSLASDGVKTYSDQSGVVPPVAPKTKKTKTSRQPLQPHHAASDNADKPNNDGSDPQVHLSKPDLSCEANYFASLDSEQLIEDVIDCNLRHAAAQPCCNGSTQFPAAETHTAQHAHAAVQTPDAAWLAAHHPALQAKYVDYVNCMGDKLTPMPLEDFCRMIGKDDRGTPVFNT